MTFQSGDGRENQAAPQLQPQHPAQPVQPVQGAEAPAQSTQQVPVASPVWAQPAPVIRWEHTNELEYHQLYRGVPKYRWWKPLLALLLGVIYYLTFQVAFLLLVLAIYGLTAGGIGFDDIEALVLPDTQNPWSIFTALGSIALMIPAVWLAMLSVGLTPIGRGWSVALRMRWRWIWRTIIPSIVALFVMNALGIAAEMGLSAASGVEPEEVVIPDIDMALALWSLLLVFLLVPIQATAEELVYRGMFMQSLGGWLGSITAKGSFGRFMRGPWIPILLPAIAFGFSHIYDVWGLLAVTAMAVAAGWLTWRTGGLEAAITLHVVNNLVAFGFMSFGAGGETGQTESGGGPGSLLGQVVGLLLYCWWVDRDFRRRDGRRTRIDLVQTRMPYVDQLDAPQTVGWQPQAPTPQPPAPQDPTQ